MGMGRALYVSDNMMDIHIHYYEVRCAGVITIARTCITLMYLTYLYTHTHQLYVKTTSSAYFDRELDRVVCLRLYAIMFMKHHLRS
jgi:hypothetical protein